MAPISQDLEPPANPGRFNPTLLEVPDSNQIQANERSINWGTGILMAYRTYPCIVTVVDPASELGAPAYIHALSNHCDIGIIVMFDKFRLRMLLALEAPNAVSSPGVRNRAANRLAVIAPVCSNSPSR